MVCQLMPPFDPRRVFISNARSDGAANRKPFLYHGWKDDQPFVKRLYGDLAQNGYEPWMDIHDMPSRGKPLPQEVIDQIGACERVIVVVGPRWLASEACQSEWTQAIEFGKVINPVLRDTSLKFPELPADLTNSSVNFQPTRTTRLRSKNSCGSSPSQQRRRGH